METPTLLPVDTGETYVRHFYFVIGIWLLVTFVVGGLFALVWFL